MTLVFGVALTLLLMDYASAEPTESAKKTTESEKEVINAPSPSMELRKKSFQQDRIKKTVDGFFNQLDADKDDKVSHDEFMVPMEDRFKGIDTNHDGFITREEFKISYKKHRETRMKMMRGQPGGKIPPKMPPK